MIGDGSRYRHVLGFAPDSEGRPTFQGLRPRDIATLPPVLEHVLSAWDRPDSLAGHYYGDPERWWQLLDANPELYFAGDITVPDPERVGGILLISRDTQR